MSKEVMQSQVRCGCRRMVVARNPFRKEAERDPVIWW
jgi:hypothetical protein